MGRDFRVKIDEDRVSYHVMTRTAHQAFFFADDAVKEAIYRIINELTAIYYVDMHSIAVLDNHYHLVLSIVRPPFDVPDIKKRFEAFQIRKRIPLSWHAWRAEEWFKRLTDLSALMKDINRSISVYVNRRKGKVGSIWGERFKSVLIEEQAGLLACMLYVELNCVRAGITESPAHYRWCSAGRFSRGGQKAAGVVIPKLELFRRVASADVRQSRFVRLVNLLAERETAGQLDLPKNLAQLEIFLGDDELKDLMQLCFRRTQWLVHSVVLGSEDFCRQIMTRFALQGSRWGETQPFKLTVNLFNQHIRAGPHSS